ncbi:FAD-binding molybdopterin dehydrogenase [Cryobacterium sp. LW097]|uniref:FAD binding domain-containing protein n=1 Tax=unclassified Cryobacterium TaxID=2649013 RepID=UPI000B4CE998|nr:MULTISPECIES: FAD binding domain-containing protein [unclassified Cryobacterium]ASD21901.1 FAD-binding molybdopterin dehydrogenase [Cryobacterium sp. LW097]TFC53525.1 FAD-binding molybdopterin dehydrogenase [Cryobacterium sp. TMB3-1-2]TFC59224.1 FAD-binding molybdopterin dehydrogenase [Cryobacterium sp. TMB1-7]TFC69191.1 FAD-binding molybdopterin dehydrogenase [Cryobacterium sp. TMB3-15]TFC76011.1 FAD-binding molybdopterin dehydrogenase [Cryobacterium sp. TMB3-10]
MDLTTVATITQARTRADLAALGETVVPLAGGSELFADPRIHLTGLVDLQTMGWPALTTGADGLEIAATCTLAELSRMPAEPGWVAHPIFHLACTALFGSFKVWNVATVGGNLCTSLPAGPMICLTAALDAEVLIWHADGTDSRMPALDFVTGNTTNVLEPGDVLRSIHVPAATLTARTAYRKIALSPLGRSGAVLIGRLDTDGRFVLTVTGGTVRPVQLRYPSLPDSAALAADIAGLDAWFTDAHGAADWRRAMSGLLGEEIRQELAAPADPPRPGTGDGSRA